MGTHHKERREHKERGVGAGRERMASFMCGSIGGEGGNQQPNNRTIEQPNYEVGKLGPGFGWGIDRMIGDRMMGLVVCWGMAKSLGAKSL
jgi:hypothetical protein